jgi:FtsH-binding integral membrane protein
VSLLPPSSNPEYRGHPAAAYFLLLLGIGWVIPGLIHVFLPDGGAGVIAGIDPGSNPSALIGAFAWAGSTQIAHGLVMIAVARWYRPLVPLLLGVSLIERGLLVLTGWVTKAPPSGHHPPEHYASGVLIPLILLSLWLSLRQKAR